MKFFDVLPQLAENELLKRGVMTDELLYCVKADLDGEGGYVDVYITFTKDTLCILRGYEEYGKMKRGQKRKNLVSFTVSGYDEYPIDSIEEMYVDRYANSARLMIKDKSGKEFPIARFSLGFADKFEKFSQRVNCTAKNEPIDDRLLEGVKTHCPTCGEPYPDPNRPRDV